ncbi:glucose-6-phosphate isomerase [Cellvibrio sp. KY-GH-1]|uniref:glucose-6-phosphate isomerase n=1 Tax=Cellvibrio sp. KY-GH-1 TaxID=2303332 RepID=UPI001247513C|nr:glucose-6-phosphate isomerase [Cellvibrio sp. KY-GH-1]QEY16107.1 glucose-6-phosphate isomerase [Cellvibrio sp. KY-GH-1]
MTNPNLRPTDLPSWKALSAHADQLKSQHMKALFASDDKRFDKFSLQLPNFLFDYSKNLITDETKAALLALAKDAEVEAWRSRMFAGEHINATEDRAVMHVALRDKSVNPIMIDGADARPAVNAELERMRKLSEKLRSGAWVGYTGKTITDIVSIGIGGSNLGPLMACEALKAYSDKRFNIHFASNIDGVQIAEVLEGLNPETTLFVISSKTFTTQETMTNARTAEQWLMKAAGDKSAIAKHFVAVSTNRKLVTAFGIAEENIFDMWDWVGGRFSLWSAIGLPIVLFLGYELFDELLQGAYEMDQHFQTAPLAENAPVMLALVGIWNRNFLGYPAHALLPYDQCLHRFPAYMQQAEMESNGKSVNWAGEQISYASVPLVWGEVGINGQHAFYQMLHQGTDIIPADFIGSVTPNIAVEGHHDALMANFFAQTQALMLGSDADQVRRDLSAKGVSPARIEEIVEHKVHRGNRPTNTILLNKVDARTLGALIALYEHKIFVQGIIWRIHSFDQWGVELGKVLAAGIQPELDVAKSTSASHDASTRNLIDFYKRAKAGE